MDVVIYWCVLCLMMVNPSTTQAPQCVNTDVGHQSCHLLDSSEIAYIVLEPLVTDLEITFEEGNITLDADIFPEMPSLVNLTVDLTHVGGMGAGVFGQLPGLRALRLVKTSLDDQSSLTRLGADVFVGLNHLKELSLTTLGLQEVDGDVLRGLGELEDLDFSDNELRDIPARMFQHTPGMLAVSAHSNQISQIPSRLCDGLLSLHTFNLASNDIDSIGRDSFSGASTLLLIDLSRNQLGSGVLLQGLFQSNDQLEQVNLEYNQIDAIQRAMFSYPNSALKKLILHHNIINYIEPESFAELSNVETLPLYNNEIGALDADMFQGLDRLQSLDLNDNRINVIRDHAMRGVSHIAILELHNNHISTIEPYGLADLTQLNVLILQNNELAELPVEMYYQLQDIRVLDLSLNPWVCDCGVSWIFVLEAQDPANNILASPTATTCSGPAELRDTNFFELQNVGDTFENCSMPTTTVVVPTSAGVVDIESTVTAASNATATGFSTNETSRWKINLIIICVILLAAIIFAIIIIWVFCQFRTDKWYPNKGVTNTETVDVSDRNKLIYMARHKHQLFYSDPETGRLETLPNRDVSVKRKPSQAKKDAMQAKKKKVPTATLR